MRGIQILAIAAGLALAGCVTTTAPDGTVTEKPDAATVAIVGGLVGQALARGEKDAMRKE